MRTIISTIILLLSVFSLQGCTALSALANDAPKAQTETTNPARHHRPGPQAWSDGGYRQFGYREADLSKPWQPPHRQQRPSPYDLTTPHRPLVMARAASGKQSPPAATVASKQMRQTRTTSPQTVAERASVKPAGTKKTIAQREGKIDPVISILASAQDVIDAPLDDFLPEISNRPLTKSPSSNKPQSRSSPMALAYRGLFPATAQLSPPSYHSASRSAGMSADIAITDPGLATARRVRKQSKPAPVIASSTAQAPRMMQRTARHEPLAHSPFVLASLNYSPKQTRAIRAEVPFSTGSVQLDIQALQLIEVLADPLRQLRKIQLLATGDRSLADTRALLVKAALIQEGVDPKRIDIAPWQHSRIGERVIVVAK